MIWMDVEAESLTSTCILEGLAKWEICVLSVRHRHKVHISAAEECDKVPHGDHSLSFFIGMVQKKDLISEQGQSLMGGSENTL